LTVNNNLLSDPISIANSLNEYFCNVGINIASKLPTSTINFSEYMMNGICHIFQPLRKTRACGIFYRVVEIVTFLFVYYYF